MRRWAALLALTLASSPATAQIMRKNPFSIGVNEGAVGEAGRLGLWLLSQQAHFYQILRTGVEHAAHNPSALFSLAFGAFAYGVPRPAIFVISPTGVVKAKLAEEGYKVRPTVQAVLDSVDALQTP